MTKLRKESRKYKAFLYWWDITPHLAEKLDQYDTMEFVKKDCGEICSVSIKELNPFLTKQRQTSRGEGNWGIKVLVEHPDELAFEAGAKDGDWLFLPVVWHQNRKNK